MFDRFIAVDWSAASRPRTGRDSIWIAVCDAADAELIELANPPTRAQAARELTRGIAGGGRVLIAIDVSLGYPAGTAGRLGLDGDPWHAMWNLLAERIVDGPTNGNNRFAVAAALNAGIIGGPGPFWGVPRLHQSPLLTTHKVAPPAGLAEWRLVEHRLRAGGKRPFSSWQLVGAGSVGSQSMLAIPMLARLLREWRATGVRCEVWPFTTGLDAPAGDADVVVAEHWPSLHRMPDGGHPVRDARQVTAVVQWLRARNAAGALGAAFAVGDATLTDAERGAVVAEEGWILGVD